jgi:hypothetical protein
LSLPVLSLGLGAIASFAMATGLLLVDQYRLKLTYFVKKIQLSSSSRF